jgi:hypothetical protein
MSLRVLTRKTKMELTTMESDVCTLLFAQKRAQHACRLFLNHMKNANGLTRLQLSRFAHDLEEGKIENGFKYSRVSFYRQIRHTLLTLGLIGIEQRFAEVPPQDLAPERSRRHDVVEKYVAIRQPIPKRPPDGLNLPRLVWIICKRWNDEFLDEKK